MESNPARPELPKRIGHSHILEEFGKVVFRETYEGSYGVISDYLLFGARRVPVIIFPLTANDEVIAIESFRFGAGQLLIELPGGQIESKKTAIETVVNELGEETQYFCAESKVQELETNGDGIWFEPAANRVRFRSFIVTDCKKKKDQTVLPEPDEHITTVRTFGIRDWFQKLASGEIKDSKSYCVSVLAIARMNASQRKAALAGFRG